jgi:hypothetical protein
MHQYLEMHVGVVRGSGKKLIYDVSRAGLEVTQYDKKGMISHRSILSEMVNYYFQYLWLEGELENNKNLWEPEISLREKVLDSLQSKGFVGEFTSEDFPDNMVNIRLLFYLPEDILPGESGKAPEISAGVVYTELAEGLSRLVGEVEGKPLLHALLMAKVNPRKQTAAQVAIDRQMGRGFYQRLKRERYYANNHSAMRLLGLLSDVQKKINGDKAF